MNRTGPPNYNDTPKVDDEKMRESNAPPYKRPNLFIVGAMKAGTTSLHAQLNQHPDIYMSPVKEPMHFSRTENWKQGTKAYMQLFAMADQQRYLGEASTEYAKCTTRTGVARRIADFNPQARIIYMTRDPFARIVSQYLHMMRNGREHRSLIDATLSDSDYLPNSYYAYQLKPYLEAFPRPQIFIGQLEQMNNDPSVFFQRLYSWLELISHETESQNLQILNSSQNAHVALDNEKPLIRLVQRLGENNWLRRKVPANWIEHVRAILPKAHKRRQLTKPSPNELSALQYALAPVLTQWQQHLAELIGDAAEIIEYPEPINIEFDVNHLRERVQNCISNLC